MIFVKINNLDSNGRIDYKGLDIEKIIPGTQVYPNSENVAYFGYDGALKSVGDIQVITEQEYLAFRQDELSKPAPPSEMDVLKQQLAEVQSVLDFVLMGGVN